MDASAILEDNIRAKGWNTFAKIITAIHIARWNMVFCDRVGLGRDERRDRRRSVFLSIPYRGKDAYMMQNAPNIPSHVDAAEDMHEVCDIVPCALIRPMAVHSRPTALTFPR
jgi:hypothetical protein